MTDNTNKIVNAIDSHAREVRDLRRAIEDLAKAQKSPAPPQEVNQIFMSDVESKHVIHLAFMDPQHPRPTCWNHSGLGGKFTITSHEDHVTCKKCLKVMAQNQ